MNTLSTPDIAAKIIAHPLYKIISEYAAEYVNMIGSPQVGLTDKLTEAQSYYIGGIRSLIRNAVDQEVTKITAEAEKRCEYLTDLGNALIKHIYIDQGGNDER